MTCHEGLPPCLLCASVPGPERTLTQPSLPMIWHVKAFSLGGDASLRAAELETFVSSSSGMPITNVTKAKKERKRMETMLAC